MADTNDIQRPDENTSFGTVTVSVRTASDAIPLEGAYVTVSRINDDGSREELAALLTGRDGRTLPISLPAPPASNSQSPGGDTGYALYNIDTDLDGYFPVRNVNVPVFGGIAAVQNVNMIPAAQGSRPREEVFFDERRTPDL